jgi:membrane dipeptidase
VFGFVHAQNTPFADSSRPNKAYGDVPGQHGGLTSLGKRAVGELNRLGVLIDVSQLTPAGVRQTVELSKTPVIASHSGLRSRVDLPRNLSDEELKLIAARGGVVHVVAFPGYLKASPQRAAEYTNNVWAPFGLKAGEDDPRTRLSAEDYQKFQAAYRQYSSNAWRYATLADYVDSVDAAIKLIGIDHVGLSSDFNHGGGVTGYANVGEAGNVTAELLKRGYSEQDIDKLWGGNFLRVLKQAENLGQQRNVAFNFGP